MNEYSEGLSAVRYPRDNVSELIQDRFGTAPHFELGKSRPLIQHDQPDVAVISYGTSGINAIEAADQLAEECAVDVHDGRFAKPVDIELVRRLVTAGVPVITVEDHGLAGGFGAQVIDACNHAGIDTSRITRLGMPERWIRQGSRSEQLAEIGIDTNGIVRTIRQVRGAETSPANARPVVENANA
jgi:1-deoxy-D-xylulose-5-phosphate synthase